jgi:hypothetical protein
MKHLECIDSKVITLLCWKILRTICWRREIFKSCQITIKIQTRSNVNNDCNIIKKFNFFFKDFLVASTIPSFPRKDWFFIETGIQSLGTSIWRLLFFHQCRQKIEKENCNFVDEGNFHHQTSARKNRQNKKGKKGWNITF